MLYNSKAKQFICISLIALISCNSKKGQLNSTSISKPNLVENDDVNLLQLASVLQFQKNAAPVQMFVVSAKSNTTITTKNGFQLALNTSNLCNEDGTNISKDNLKVSIQELLNTDALLAANATTVCDGKILESGGSYFLSIVQNNKSLKIKPSKGLQIKIPKQKQNGMELFYGQKTSDGFINWQTTKQKFSEPVAFKKSANWYNSFRNVKVGDSLGKRPATLAESIKIHHDSTMKARWAYTIAHRSTMSYEQEMRYGLQPIKFPMEKFLKGIYKSDTFIKYFSGCLAFHNVNGLAQTSNMYFVNDTFPIYKEIKDKINLSTSDALEYFEPVEINNLGWINVDKFYNAPICDSTMLVIDNNEAIRNCKIYYKFKNRNSIMAETAMFTKNTTNTNIKLPINENIEIIVFAVTNKKIYSAKQLVTIQRKNKFYLHLQETKTKPIT